MTKNLELEKAKKESLENLNLMQRTLDECVERGMIDEKSKYHNAIVDLVDDVKIVKAWEELEEAITIAKTLEVDIDAWISLHGGSTVGFSWPKRKQIE